MPWGSRDQNDHLKKIKSLRFYNFCEALESTFPLLNGSIAPGERSIQRQEQAAIVAMARYEAEEKIKARERQLTALKQGPDSPVPVTAHVQERSGESAAIIAEKAGVKTRNVYEVRRASITNDMNCDTKGDQNDQVKSVREVHRQEHALRPSKQPDQNDQVNSSESPISKNMLFDKVVRVKIYRTKRRSESHISRNMLLETRLQKYTKFVFVYLVKSRPR